MYTFEYVSDVRKKFVDKPEYIPEKWKHVVTNDKYDDNDFDSIDIDVQTLWYDSIDHIWSHSFDEGTGVALKYNDASDLKDMGVVNSVIDCGKIAMKKLNASEEARRLRSSLKRPFTKNLPT